MTKEDACLTCAKLRFNDAVVGKGCVGNIICMIGSINPNKRIIQITAEDKDSTHKSTVKDFTCPISSEEYEVKYNLKN